MKGLIKKYEWSDSVATGDAVIDLQHKQFFSALYDYAVDIEKGKGAKKLKKLLIFLKYYGEWHFGSEEKKVDQCKNCPLACENKEAHEFYMVTINALLKKIRETGTSDELALSSYETLTDWLVNHIMKIDTVNANFLKLNKENATIK